MTHGSRKGRNKSDKIARARNYYLDDFINFLAIERNLSPRTIKEYSHDLKIFFEFFKPMLEQELTLETIDERTIREFLTYLKMERDYSPKSLNRKISTLKAYFRFLENEGYIDKSPMERVKTVKMGKHFPRVFSRSEVKQILDGKPTVGPQAKTKKRKKRTYKMPFDPEIRDKAILELFYATGMRISELSSLNLEDIDFEKKMIKVCGKGNKQRMVIMNDSASQALQDWLKVRPGRGKAVFLNRNKKRISPRAIQIMFKKKLAKSGVSREGSPHTLRHSFATHLLESGADLVSIKELLGHESLSTTQIYTNIAMNRIKKVYEENFPRK